jgi:predicted transcriptional regulator
MTLLLSEKTPKRRDQLVIMAEIISIAKKDVFKTHIMIEANLSFSQLNEFMTILLQANLIRKSVTDGKETYIATEKGLQFMESQCQAIRLLNQDLHNNRVKTSLPITTLFTQRNMPSIGPLELIPG